MTVQPEIHEKGWGRELWLYNSEKYAFKVLEFRSGARGSLHYHLKKTETWFVISGAFQVTVVDPLTAEPSTHLLTAGNVFHVEAGVAHRLICRTEGAIAEASTQHFETDSYRIEKGDSQR